MGIIRATGPKLSRLAFKCGPLVPALRGLILRLDTPLEADVKGMTAGQLDAAQGRFAAIGHGHHGDSRASRPSAARPGQITAHTNAGNVDLASVSGLVEVTGHAGSIAGRNVSSTRVTLRTAARGIDVTFSADECVPEACRGGPGLRQHGFCAARSGPVPEGGSAGPAGRVRT